VTEHAHVRFDRREIVHGDPEKFDRIAFTLRALRLASPANMTVVVYEGCLELRSTSGMDPRHGPEGKWGMLSIPPRASREEIALAVAQLAGRSGDAYLVDLMLSPSAAPV
jgi:hypothetical protein